MKSFKFIAVLIVVLAVLLGCQSQFMRSGNMYLQVEKYDKAIAQYEMELKKNPKNVEAYKKIAGIYFEIKTDYIKAYNYYTKAQRIIEEAGKEDEQLVKFRKSCYIKIYKKAQASFNEENYDKSLDYISQLENLDLELTDKLLEARLKLKSYNYAKMKNVEKQMEINKKIAEKFPNDINSRSILANHYYNGSNYEQAVKYYKQIEKIQPEDVNNVFNIGLVYNLMENKTEAEKYFEKALALNPEDDLKVSLYEVLGNFAYNNGNNKRAIENYKALIELKPNNKNYISFLCRLLGNEKRFKDLLTYSKKWLELEPENDKAKQLYQWAKNNN